MTVQEFNTLVETSEKLILVDFYANWCGPCRLLLPVVDALHEQHMGKLEVLKVDAEIEKELVAHFQIRSIPSVFLYKGGQRLDLGGIHKGNIEDLVTQHI